MTRGGDRSIFAVAEILIVVLDAITKYIAELRLGAGETIAVVGEWIRLHLVYNRGAAFGLHLGPYSRWIFLVIAVLAVVILYRMSASSPPGDRFRQLALGLVAGGAVGNLIDRIRSEQGVVDFLDVGIGALRWPTFNVADIGVSCGAIALALSLWREDVRKPAADSAAG